VIRAAGGDYLFDITGSAGYIWLRNPAAAATVAQALVDRIAHVSYAHYQTLQSGSYTYHTLAKTGQIVEPHMEAALGYLLSTFAGATAADIVLTFEENTIVTSVTNPHGEHSGPSWGSQHVPLVIAGPGVKANSHSLFPARLMDIAPTVLTLLSIAPTGMDGLVLADALAAPMQPQVDAQDRLAPELTAYKSAIVARSKADIAVQQGKTPPASPS
jgi:hypothetical protein